MRIAKWSVVTALASATVLAGIVAAPAGASQPQDLRPSAVTPAPKPTPKRLADVITGKTVLRAGDRGPAVANVQLRLANVGLYYGRTHGVYDSATAVSVTRLQEKFLYTETGRVNKYTYQLLWAISRRGAQLPAPCNRGVVVCVDKSQRILRLVSDGRVVLAMDARFGIAGRDTREGLFHVFAKEANDYSRLYGVPMPLAMYFSGGQAIHFSFGFLRDGYYGASAGCVNLRAWRQAAALFNNTPMGAPVLIYR